MLSPPIAEPSQLLRWRTTRRGGPHLFRSLWPEVGATLAEAAGLSPVEPQGEQAAGGEPPRPPWSRAA